MSQSMPHPMQHFLQTYWSVDTAQGHIVDVTHRNVPVVDMDDAARCKIHICTMSLTADGFLSYWDDRSKEIIKVAGEDVQISVFTRPQDQRGAPFIPDLPTSEGMNRILSTLTDPAYISTPDEFQPVSISLRELAATPGAAGKLESLAYGMSGLPAE